MTCALGRVVRLLAATVATVCVWMGLWHPAEVSAVPLTSTATYAYDGQHHPALLTHAASERGPSATYDRDAEHFAVDRWSRGASARPVGPTTPLAYVYNDRTQFVQIAGLASTTQRPAVGTLAEPSSRERSQAAANAGDDVVRALSATERRTLDDALRPDKLDHVFDPKHKFQPLVQQFGSREAAMEQIVRSIGGPLPQAGRFEIAQSVGGQAVVIRGFVVDGIPRIGTAYTP